MPGNSRRKGAVRKAGSKKGPTVGSGGQRRQGLEGRGPTPKAEERPYHPAAKRKAASDRREDGPARKRAPIRPKEKSFEVIGGRNSVVEALRADIPVTTVYLSSRIESDERTREILRAVTDRALPLLEVSKAELDKLTDGGVHQGVALQVPAYAYVRPEDLLELASESGHTPLIVALDGVTDPRNLGAALRSAGAFGADGVVVPQRRAAGVTASAWKVSAGAAARVPVARATNLVRALETYQAAGCFVVGLDGEGPDTIGEFNLAAEPLVIVCGSEGKGLSRLVREKCDLIVSIPIASAVESLNAGVAVGIALYEVSRRRQA